VEDAQMCAQETFDVLVPPWVADLLEDAFSVARQRAGRALTDAECMERIARTFVATCRGVHGGQSASPQPDRRWDGYCQVPGCSRRARRSHRVRGRPGSGAGEVESVVGVCVAHLRCIGLGSVRVSGRAPGALVWELGGRYEEAPPVLPRVPE
jgi:hypothetical protein